MHQAAQRNRVFISYNQADKVWLDLVMAHLRPQIRDEQLNVFAGEQIAWGADWLAEIEAALASARVAILLVSKHFLASDFIAERELPPLLAAAEREEVKILSLLISPSCWPKTLSTYQAVNPPSRTLSEMTEPELDRVMVRLAKHIRTVMNPEAVSRC